MTNKELFEQLNEQVNGREIVETWEEARNEYYKDGTASSNVETMEEFIRENYFIIQDNWTPEEHLFYITYEGEDNE